MTILKRIVAAILLTALIVANGSQLLDDLGINTFDCNQASLTPIQYKKKTFDLGGSYVGCYGTGSDCITIEIMSAEIAISTEGIHLQ